MITVYTKQIHMYASFSHSARCCSDFYFYFVSPSVCVNVIVILKTLLQKSKKKKVKERQNEQKWDTKLQKKKNMNCVLGLLHVCAQGLIVS